MKLTSKRSATLAVAFVVAVSAAPAFAMGDWPPKDPRPGRGDVANVPEIDAASGLAALAAVFGAMGLAWERRRRT